MSEAILRLVTLAEADGLKADVGDWSKAKMYWFEAPMPADVRAAGRADSSLDYVESERTPHNPPNEGFIDRAAATAISFLIKNKEA